MSHKSIYNPPYQFSASVNARLVYAWEGEVESLRARIERLQSALAMIADGDAYHDGAARFMQIAREALEHK